jgi:lipoyl-dependent peroxiredoxin
VRALSRRSPPRDVKGSGIRFTYPQLGASTGTRLVLQPHFPDNIDAGYPAVVNVAAARGHSMHALYTAEVTSIGGRDGRAVSSDAILELTLTMPKELGGKGTGGTNPEMLFAAGYSACFLNALRYAGGQLSIAIPAEAKVTARVTIGRNDTGGSARFALAVELNVSLPGMAQALVSKLLEAADQVCPYSNATRGNIEVRITSL